MSKYLVTSPSGQKYEVTGPDGATEADAIAWAQKNLAQPEAASTARAEDSIFSRIADRVTDAVQPIWQAPTLGQEEIQNLPIDPASKQLLKSGAAAFDATGRIISTVTRGAGALAGQVAEELGESPAMSRRLERDIGGAGGLLEMGGLLLGARAPQAGPRVAAPPAKSMATPSKSTAVKPPDAASPVAPTPATDIQLSDIFGWGSEPRPPLGGKLGAGKNFAPGELRAEGARSDFATKPGLVSEARAGLPLQKEIMAAAKDVLKAGDVPVAPGGESLRIYEQVASLLRAGRIDTPQLADVLSKYNLTTEQFARGMGVDVSNAGRTLQIQSSLAQSLKKMDPDGFGINAPIVDDRGIFRRVNDIRRGLMVSQIKTAARNATTAAANVGVQTVNRAIEYGIRKAARGKFNISEVGEDAPMQTPADVFGLLVQSARPIESRKILKEALKYSPDKYDSLMRAYSADVTFNGKTSIFRPLEKGVYALNVFNRFQDQAFRSVAFSDSLIRQMKARGVDARDLLRNNQMSEIPKDVLDKATEDALAFTFSDAPKSAFGKGFVEVFDNPALSILVPFPRFLVASTRYTVEHSPLGLAYELSKVPLNKGNVSQIAKGVTGTGLFLGAYALANSEYAGDKWYRYKVGGKDIDIRAYYPFAAAFWVADAVKRLENGTLFDLNAKDIAEGLIGVQVRGGTGNYLIDGFADAMQGDGTAREKAIKAGGRLVGEYIASFGTPLQQFRDAYSLYDPDQKIVWDVDKRPVLGPLATRFPGGGQLLDLDPAISPFRKDPITRQNPVMAQLTGITYSQPMTPIQSELARLDLPQSTYVPKYKNPELRRLAAQETAKILDTSSAQRALSNVIRKFPNNPEGNASSRLVQKEIGAAIKKAVRERVAIMRPDLTALEKISGLRQELQRILPGELGEVRRLLRGAAPQ